jgi:hypothetical protein
MLPLPLKLRGVELDQGPIHMEKIITINDEVHADCGLRNAE